MCSISLHSYDHKCSISTLNHRISFLNVANFTLIAHLYGSIQYKHECTVTVNIHKCQINSPAGDTVYQKNHQKNITGSWPWLLNIFKAD